MQNRKIIEIDIMNKFINKLPARIATGKNTKDMNKIFSILTILLIKLIRIKILVAGDGFEPPTSRL